VGVGGDKKEIRSDLDRSGAREKATKKIKKKKIRKPALESEVYKNCGNWIDTVNNRGTLRTNYSLCTGIKVTRTPPSFPWSYSTSQEHKKETTENCGLILLKLSQS